jgi:hypothetical protein
MHDRSLCVAHLMQDEGPDALQYRRLLMAV